MPRVTVSIPNNIYDKLVKYAGDNEESLSYTVTKMAELGPHLTQQFLTEIQKCIYFALSVFKDKGNENRFFRYLQ